VAKHEPPSLIEIDALLTGESNDEDAALWTSLVRAPGAGDAWRRAQTVRAQLDGLVELTGRCPWLVEPWLAVRATRRFVTERLPAIIVGDLQASGVAPVALGVLGPARAEPSARAVTLRWGQIVELRLAIGTTIAVRTPAGVRVEPEWRSNMHAQPVLSPGWRLEAGEAPVLVTVEQDGACAGLVILEG
jgi:hypothetical protein